MTIRMIDFVLDLELCSLLFLFGMAPKQNLMFTLTSIILLARHRKFILRFPFEISLLSMRNVRIIPKSSISERWEAVESESKRLRGFILQCTDCNCDGPPKSCIAVASICKILKHNPRLISEAIDIIIERVKDKCVTTAFTALELLDKCMTVIGFEFQFYVAKLALKRVLLLAYPTSGTHLIVQRKADSLIDHWAATLGSDSRIPGFASAAADLNRQKTCHFDNRAGFRGPLSLDRTGDAPAKQRNRRLSALSTAELIGLAKASQQAIMDQIRTAKDPKQLRALRALHDQLAADLADYYSRSEPCESSDPASYPQPISPKGSELRHAESKEASSLTTVLGSGRCGPSALRVGMSASLTQKRASVRTAIG